ncbi:hypothetical protein FQN54_003799 [Arachnomyces sp. PD_36]|nr:hypothetical protein FQN54_003799 [Arachnomyces sp. PD_36]
MKGTIISALTGLASMTAAGAVMGNQGFDGMEDASIGLSKIQGGDTENDLIDGDCMNVTVIFARGTTEPGNVGSLAGPPFFESLDAALGAGQLAVQGVDYPADIPGYLDGGSKEGAETMAGHVADAVSKCPDTKIVMSGYSQGAQVTHLAGNSLSASDAAHVSAVVVFGDPYKDEPIENISSDNILTFCAEGDLICEGQPIVLIPHLSYGANADEAADFVVSKVA